MLPPILMQVDDPSTLTKPGPYSAQGFAAAFADRSGSVLAGLPSRDCCADAVGADNTATMTTGTIVRIRRILPRPARLCYRTNLTPSNFPRRQTTSQFRPVRASRANAKRSRPDKALESSTVILAPEADMSWTTSPRTASPSDWMRRGL